VIGGDERLVFLDRARPIVQLLGQRRHQRVRALGPIALGTSTDARCSGAKPDGSPASASAWPSASCAM
jgi:hypothetical protein